MAKGGSCSKLFSQDHYQKIQDHCAGLTRTELDFVVLGQIMANIDLEETVGGGGTGHPAVPRQMSRLSFSHQKKRICRATFLQQVSLTIKTTEEGRITSLQGRTDSRH